MAWDAALAVLLAMHLVAMNVATAAPLVALWLRVRSARRGDDDAGRLGRWLIGQSLIGVLAGTMLGAASVGLLWQRGGSAFFEAAAAVPRSRLWFGLAELAFFVVLLAVCYAVWDRRPRRVAVIAALILLAASNLIYHFPPLFAVFSVVESQPALHGRALSREAFLTLLIEPGTLARVAHFLLASLAVTGTMMLVAALRWRKVGLVSNPSADRDGLKTRATGEDGLKTHPTTAAAKFAGWGGRLAFIATAAQLPGGMWLLFQLTLGQRRQLLGDDPWAAALFAAGLLASLVLLYELSQVALGETAPAVLKRAICLTLLVVLLMTGMRQRVQPTVSSTRHGATVQSLATSATDH